MVVDTSAVIAILAGGSEGPAIGRAIADATGAVMSAANYLELMMVALSRGLAGRVEVDGLLADGRIQLVSVSVQQVGLAVEAFERFGKGRHPAKLNFGQCFAYALAMSRDEPLLFKGGDFARTDLRSAL